MSGVASFSAQRAIAMVQGRRLKASGYLIAPDLVATCAHFLDEDTPFHGVRWDGTSMDLDMDRTLSWPAADIALIFARTAEEVDPVTLGVIDRMYPDRIDFQMYGWPLWGADIGSDGLSQDGGRMIRGHIEPSDTSTDMNSLVLQPDRAGAGHLRGRSDWAGMSGAGVFVLDRWVGVQRRHVDVRRPDSIEARPTEIVLDDPGFRAAMQAAGIDVDDEFTLVGTRARGERFEIHGPESVPLFSVTDFSARTEGWELALWRVAGAAATSPEEQSLSRPVETLTVTTNHEEDLGQTGELVVEARSPGRGRSLTLVHSFDVAPPGPLQIAALFEMAMWFLDLARAGGSPSENLRAALASERAWGMLRSALSAADPDPLLERASRVLGPMRASTAWARTEASRRLVDKRASLDPEERKEAKHSYHPAYVLRKELAEEALGSFDGTDPFWSRAVRVLNYSSYDAVLRYLRPPLVDQVADPHSFQSSVLELLLHDGLLDTSSEDYTTATGEVQGAMYDLVNAMLREGVARWRDDQCLVPTAAGRLRLRGLIDGFN